MAGVKKNHRETSLPKIHRREFGKSKVYLSVNLKKSNSKESLLNSGNTTNRDVSLPKLEHATSEAMLSEVSVKTFESSQREKSITFQEPEQHGLGKEKSSKVPHPPVNSRLAYMVLSLLNKRDVFGLDHLEDDETVQTEKQLQQQRFNKSGKKVNTAENTNKIILISEQTGAEVIIVNKRFFSSCADVATLLKIDKLVRRVLFLKSVFFSISNFFFQF